VGQIALDPMVEEHGAAYLVLVLYTTVKNTHSWRQNRLCMGAFGTVTGRFSKFIVGQYDSAAVLPAYMLRTLLANN